jgi:hypothetical protein
MGFLWSRGMIFFFLLSFSVVHILCLYSALVFTFFVSILPLYSQSRATIASVAIVYFLLVYRVVSHASFLLLETTEITSIPLLSLQSSIRSRHHHLHPPRLPS